MVRLTVHQILAYKLRKEDFARLNKSQTKKYRCVKKLWKQLGPGNAQSLREKRQADMVAAKRELLEALDQHGALRQTAEAAAPTAASKKVARRPAARRR